MMQENKTVVHEKELGESEIKQFIRAAVTCPEYSQNFNQLVQFDPNSTIPFGNFNQLSNQLAQILAKFSVTF